MGNKNLTAVDWLANELFKQLTGEPDKISLKEVLEQAKAMEKEQLLDMGNQFAIMGEDSPEQYYTETYERK